MTIKQKVALITGITGQDGFYRVKGLQHAYVEFCPDNES